MGLGDNFTTNISEWLHTTNVKEAHLSSIKVNYIWQMLKHNDWCTCLNYMEAIFSYLALQDWYNIDPAKVFNLLSTTDKQQSVGRAYMLCLQTIDDERFIHHISQWLYHLREMYVCAVCRSIKITLLTDASKHFGIANYSLLFHIQIEENWRHKVSGLVLGYDQNVLLHSTFIKLQNGLLYYHQPFYNPTSVEHLGLDCKVDYTNRNQWIMPEAHNIWVQYMQIDENDLDDTFEGQSPSFIVLYFSWASPNQILPFQECLRAQKALSTFSKRCKKTQQWVLRPQAQEYAVVIPTQYRVHHGWADCVDRFITVVTLTHIMHIVPPAAIVGPAHIGWENAASGAIVCVWFVNSHVDLDTYWTVY